MKVKLLTSLVTVQGIFGRTVFSSSCTSLRAGALKPFTYLSTDPFFTVERNKRRCVGLVVKTAHLQLALLPASRVRQWEVCDSCDLAELGRALQASLGNGLICSRCCEVPHHLTLLGSAKAGSSSSWARLLDSYMCISDYSGSLFPY